jgi:ketosteroid isomerase-like protein
VTTIDELITLWCEAEREGDSSALDRLLHDDFRGVGPVGFVLTKERWLDRYRHGDLVNESFTWEELDSRTYGDTIVTVGVQAQTSAYQGRDSSGRFRGSLVARRDGERLSIVHIQLSMMAGPPGG